MADITLRQRARAALNGWRSAPMRPDEYDRARAMVRFGETKQAPYIWPNYRIDSVLYPQADIGVYLEEGYNANAVIYAAIMYKAFASTQPKMRAYRGDPEEPKALPLNHPLARLVQRPNKSQSWREYQMLQAIYINVAGDAFTVIDRRNSERGVPSSLWPVSPLRMRIIVKGKNKIGYRYIPESASESDGINFLPQDVIHTKFPNPGDPLDGEGYGMPPISALSYSGDVDNMISKFLRIFFKHGAMVSGLLSFEQDIDPIFIDETREKWREIYGGYDNWDNIGVLGRGGQYQRVALTFDEMGFSELDERNESRILADLGVPPILIGSRLGMLHSTYSNYEQAREAFWKDRFLSEIGLFEDDYQYYLQSDDGGFVGLDYTDVPALQADIPSLVTAWASLFDRGVTRANAAQVVGLKIPNQSMNDVSFMPLNVLPVGADSAPDQSAAGMENADEDDRGETAKLGELVQELKAAREILEREVK